MDAAPTSPRASASPADSAGAMGKQDREVADLVTAMSKTGSLAPWVDAGLRHFLRGLAGGVASRSGHPRHAGAALAILLRRSPMPHNLPWDNQVRLRLAKALRLAAPGLATTAAARILHHRLDPVLLPAREDRHPRRMEGLLKQGFLPRLHLALARPGGKDSAANNAARWKQALRLAPGASFAVDPMDLLPGWNQLPIDEVVTRMAAAVRDLVKTAGDARPGFALKIGPHAGLTIPCLHRLLDDPPPMRSGEMALVFDHTRPAAIEEARPCLRAWREAAESAGGRLRLLVADGSCARGGPVLQSSAWPGFTSFFNRAAALAGEAEIALGLASCHPAHLLYAITTGSRPGSLEIETHAPMASLLADLPRGRGIRLVTHLVAANRREIARACLSLLADFPGSPSTIKNLPVDPSAGEGVPGALEKLDAVAPVAVSPIISGTVRHGERDAPQGWVRNPDLIAFSAANEELVEEAIRTAGPAQRTTPFDDPGQSFPIIRSWGRHLTDAAPEIVASLVRESAMTTAQALGEVARAEAWATRLASGEAEALPSDVVRQSVGTLVVAGAWDTPFADPFRDITAALVAGNAVLFRPAPEAALSGQHLVSLLHASGVPHDLLAFLPMYDDLTTRQLLAGSRVQGTVLAGQGGLLPMHRGAPPNNAAPPRLAHGVMVVTSAAHPEQAAEDLASSAFAWSGQRRDGASLALVDKVLLDDPAFRRRLEELAHAWSATGPGSTWEGVTPLAHGDDPSVLRALTTLDDGEQWLVQPGKPGLSKHAPWSPGIRTGLRPDGWFARHRTRAPVLGVVAVDGLRQATRILADLPPPPVACLHSCDPAEIDQWLCRPLCPELRVNAPSTHPVTTSAAPSGGPRLAPDGPGPHAGGPHHHLAFCLCEQDTIPEILAELDAQAGDVLNTMKRWLRTEVERRLVDAAARSYRHAMDQVIRPGIILPAPSPEVEMRLLFRPCPGTILLRLRSPVEATDLAGATLAALCSGVDLEFSLPQASSFADALGIGSTTETEDELAGRLAREADRYTFLRLPQSAGGELLATARSHGLAVSLHPLLANGRIEMLQWMQEVVVVRRVG